MLLNNFIWCCVEIKSLQTLKSCNNLILYLQSFYMVLITCMETLKWFLVQYVYSMSVCVKCFFLLLYFLRNSIIFSDVTPKFILPYRNYDSNLLFCKKKLHKFCETWMKQERSLCNGKLTTILHTQTKNQWMNTVTLLWFTNLFIWCWWMTECTVFKSLYSFIFRQNDDRSNSRLIIAI